MTNLSSLSLVNAHNKAKYKGKYTRLVSQPITTLTKSSATIIIMFGFCAYWAFCAFPQEIEQSRTHILRTSDLGRRRRKAK